MIKLIALTVAITVASLSCSFASCEGGKCEKPKPSPTATPAP